MRGQKPSNEVKEKVKVAIAASGNTTEVARQFNLPESTVSTWKKKWMQDPEFQQLQADFKLKFQKEAEEIIFAAMQVMKEKLPKASAAQAATIAAIMYDKRALTVGEATENQAVYIKVKMPKELDNEDDY